MKKTYVIDLDGTMFHGDKIIESAKRWLDTLIANNHPFIFLTNNATRTRKENALHMQKMGYTSIHENHFFTSSMAASAYAAKQFTQRDCFFIGSKGLEEALINEGFHFVEENAAIVFVGLQMDADYDSYSKALSNLLQGSTFIATNVDRRLPSSDGFKVGNGAVVAMLEYASEKESIKVGKPYRIILDECLAHYGLHREEIILVGDNLETDILLGIQSQVDHVFVSTGVHTKEDMYRLNIHALRCVSSLEELVEDR